VVAGEGRPQLAIGNANKSGAGGGGPQFTIERVSIALPNVYGLPRIKDKRTGALSTGVDHARDFFGKAEFLTTSFGLEEGSPVKGGAAADQGREDVREERNDNQPLWGGRHPSEADG
jgi:hypothetical protein